MDNNFSTNVIDKSYEFSLEKVYEVLRRRRKVALVGSSFVFSLTIFITIIQRLFFPAYEGSFSLLIDDPITNEQDNSPLAGSKASSKMLQNLALNATDNDIPTLIEVLKSQLLIEPIAEKYNIKSYKLVKKIDIRTGGSRVDEAEGVLNVFFQGKNPRKTKLILDDLADSYLKIALDQRQKRLNDGLSFLNTQAPSLEKKTQILQTELSTFRKKHNLLEPVLEASEIKTKIARLKSLIVSLKAEKERLLLIREQIENDKLSAIGFQQAITLDATDGSNFSKTNGLTISGVDQNTLEELLKVETELASARAKFQPQSKIIIGLEKRLSAIKPVLKENQLEAVDSAIALNEGSMLSNQIQSEELSNQFLMQPELIKEYEDIQQRLLIAKENLAGLVSARENFQLEIAQRSVPWSLIAFPMVKKNPISPSIPNNLVLGLFFSGLAGLGLAFLKENLDAYFHKKEDIESFLKFPVIAQLPYFPIFKETRRSSTDLITRINNMNNSQQLNKENSYNRFVYQETFRSFYTSIRYLASEKPLKVLSITSTLPKEGKSLVNALLAKTIADIGKKVLVVDLDLRKSTIHKLFGIDNIVGVTNYVTQDNENWEDLLQEVPDSNNIKILTSGIRPPDPTRILTSRKLANLIEELGKSNKFDYIVMDIPPILGLSDVGLLLDKIDGIMFLVTLERVQKKIALRASQKLKELGAAVLGIVVNTVDEIKVNEDGSPYGYGYGYKYGEYNYVYEAYNDDEDSDEKSNQKKESEKQIKDEKTSSASKLLEVLNINFKKFLKWLDK